MNIHQADKVKANSNFGQGGAIKIQNTATNWLKKNLDLDIDELPLIEAEDNRIRSAMPTNSRRRGDQIIRSGSQSAILKTPGVALSEANLDQLNGRLPKNRSMVGVPSSQGGRPMSAATYTT